MAYTKVILVLQELNLLKYKTQFEENGVTDLKLKEYYDLGVLPDLLKDMIPVVLHRFDILGKLKILMDSDNTRVDVEFEGVSDSGESVAQVSCTICKVRLNQSWESIWEHLKTFHFLRQRSFPLVCPYCQSSFSVFKSFRKHVRSHSQKSQRPTQFLKADQQRGSESVFEESTTCYSPNVLNDGNWETTVVSLIEQFRDDAVSFAVQLRSNPKVTLTLANEITTKVSVLVQKMSNCSVSILTSTDHGTQEKSDLFSQIASSFEPVATTYKLKKYLLRSGYYIPAEEVVLGSKTTIVKGKAKSIFHVAHYVPIIPTLEKILILPGLMRSVLNTNAEIDGDFFTSPVCGQYLRRKVESSKLPVVLLLVYYDECEICNPLGARAGVHKIGNVYFSILNAEQRYNSKLENIYLLYTLRSALLQKFSFAHIPSRFTADLQTLEHSNIYVTCADYTGEVKVLLGQLTGDNLGLHQLLGFSESFSATYHCRYCRMPKYRTSNACHLNRRLLRNKPNYEEDMKANDLSKTGIKRGSLLNDIPDFHVTENYAPDILHDILEGVAGYDIKFVLIFIMSSTELNINDLNAKIDGFDYAHLANDKPEKLSESYIKNTSSHLLGQSAAQTLCLLHTIPHLFGSDVPEDCQPWKLLLLLLDILDICQSTTIPKSVLPFLGCLIQDHHYLYQVVSNSTLKPKHHHMLHYPDIIEQIGPHRPYWTMRFEARHRSFKQLARITCNFKNITRTLSDRNQLALSYKFQQNKPYDIFSVVFGKQIGVETNLDTETTCYFKSAMINDVCIKIGNVLNVDYVEDLTSPIFGKVTKISSVGDKRSVSVKLLDKIDFSKHYYSYAVQEGSSAEVTYDINELESYFPRLCLYTKECLLISAFKSI